MTKYAYQYAIVRYVPFVETEEFANIGIVIYCAKTGEFDYKLQNKKYARITHFFEPLKREIFHASVENILEELKRIKKMTFRDTSAQMRLNLHESTFNDGFFQELTRPREGTIRFSKTRAILGQGIEDQLDKLFKHYVDRNFVNQQYGEALLEDSLRTLLKEKNLSNRFEKADITDGIYKKSFPFVEFNNDKITRVIKPFFLAQKHPTKIIDRGITWINAVNRFRNAEKLPDNLLFAVEGPETSGSTQEAYDEVMSEMGKNDITAIPFTQTEQIIEFVQR